jgi:hypothetical protein
MTTAPLSKVQYGLYVECVAHQGEACYNLPYLYVLDGTLDGDKLCRAIETAVAAHPTLFTRIKLDENGDPYQSVDDSETFALNIENGTLNIEDGGTFRSAEGRLLPSGRKKSEESVFSVLSV